MTVFILCEGGELGKGEGEESGVEEVTFLIKEGPTYSKISAGVGEQGKISPYSYFRRCHDQVDISFVLLF